MSGDKYLTQKNIYELFKNSVENRGKNPGLKYKEAGQWKSISWNEWFDISKSLSKSLLELGLKKGSKVNILSSTNANWVMTDVGIIIAGFVTAPIYQSNTAREVLYIINHSEAEVIFVENKIQLDKVLSIKDELKNIKKIVLMKGEVDNDRLITTFNDFVTTGKNLKNDSDFEKQAESTEQTDLASIVYTSGTTGVPKGVMLTHQNFIYVSSVMEELSELNPLEDENFAWLPYAHILGRISQYTMIKSGVTTSFARGIDSLLEDMADAKPTTVTCVPRIYEKIYTKITMGLETASPVKKSLFNWSMEIGAKVGEYKQKNRQVPTFLQLKHDLANKLVLHKIHELFGGKIKFFISGGAPLSKDIADFFHSAGVLILEGYGLTETTAPINVNQPKKYKFGTVGPIMPGTEEKIAEDGEILARGPGIMTGYYNSPDETKEVLEENGWFHTGDIGEFDDDGMLRITDRKKDLIVTAGGKNIAPQYIENLMKTSPFISQCFTSGDKRKYITALITLDYEELEPYAKENGINYNEPTDLASDPQIYELVKKEIEDRNRQLASYETIKKFKIIPNDFSIESGELTPTMKLKRKVVSKKYAELLDSMYEEKFD